MKALGIASGHNGIFLFMSGCYVDALGTIAGTAEKNTGRG